MDFKLTPKAQEIKDFGGSIEIPEDREDLRNFADEISCSDGFGYGLFDGGYIHPESLIEDKDQLKQLNDAIDLVGKFKALWEFISTEV